jgi:SAM-dependent methyltransferase
MTKAQNPKPNPDADDKLLALKKKGRTLLHQGQREQAEKILNEALRVEPDASDILFLLGQSAHSAEDYATAIDYYRRSLRGGAFFDTYKALASALIGARDLNEALKILGEATNKFGWDYDSVILAAMAYIYMSDLEKAREFLLKAIRREPDRLPAKAYINHLLQIGYTPPYDESFKAALLTCLKETRMDHGPFGPAWAQQIAGDPEAQSLRELLQAKDYAAFAALFAQEKNRRFMQEPYFTAGLDKLILHKPVFEKLLAHTRRFYLEIIHEGESLNDGDLALLCAIASNCYLSEYIPSFTDDEEILLADIKQNIEQQAFILPEYVAVYAAYRSLTTLKLKKPLYKSSHLLRHMVGKLIRTQVMEPEEEAAIKKKLERLTTIDDGISKAVQGMYEENPYPRWQCTGVYTSLDPAFARGAGKKILIAGCGTGKQAVHVAAFWPEADVLAIDLSMSSLAYASRKLREYSYDNITFKQADILKLGEVLEPESFDRVESTGVLHHMKDPMAGWRVLTKLLKPGGEMNIGLYSRLSRIHVDKMRQMIIDKGYRPDRDNIQEVRHHIMSLPVDDPLYSITTWQDFYSLSNCRDLLFHVQERNYSLEEIKECLDELGLEFAGFKKWPHSYIKQYREAYPDDKKMTDIMNWHELELKNPEMFANHNIYLFYVRKLDRKT